MHNRAGPVQSPWLTLLVVCTVSILMALNMSTLNIALPVLVRHFEADASTGSWLLLSYMMTNSATLVIFGRLGDVTGQRFIYLLGLTGFTLTSLLCGLAPTIEILIILRSLQGLASAILLTNGATLIHSAFASDQLGKAMGYYAASFSVANLFGPTLGGLLVEAAGWQWVFWFNVPLCVLGLYWGFRHLRGQPALEGKQSLDLGGNFITMVSLLMLVFGISQASELGWSNVYVWGTALAALLFVPILVMVERRAKNPIFDPHVLRTNGVLGVYVGGMLNAAARFPLITLMSLYFQIVLGHSALVAGMMLIPMPVGTITSAMCMGWLTTRATARQLTSTGSAMGLVGLVLVTVGVSSGVLWTLLLGLCIVGSGTGIFLGANATALLQSLPSNKVGVGNAVRLMVQNAGTLLATAGVLTIITGSVAAGDRSAVLGGMPGAIEPQVLIPGFQWGLAAMLVLSVAGLAVCIYNQRHDVSNSGMT